MRSGSLRVVGCFATYLLVGLLVGLLAGCSNSHAHPATPDNSSFVDTEGPRGWVCGSGERSVVDPRDEVAVLGFAPASVLDFAVGTHHAPLRWVDDGGPLRYGDGTLTVSPEQGEGTLEVAIERAGDVMLFSPESIWSGHGATCRYWFEIPVRVTLTSSGTALRETLHATLRTRHPRSAFLAVQTTSGLLGGAFSTRVRVEGQEVAPTRLSLHLAISERAMSGELIGDWYADPESVPYVFETLRLATWGPADCELNSFLTAFAEPIEDSVAESMLDRIANLGTLGVSWNDGARSTATLAFVPDLAGTCFEESFAANTFRVSTFGTITLRSADGRLDAELHGSATINTGPALTTDGIRLSSGSYESAGLTPAELGFPQVPADAVTLPHTSFSLTLDATDQFADPSTFTLWGHAPACASAEPPPHPACVLSDVVMKATFSR